MYIAASVAEQEDGASEAMEPSQYSHRGGYRSRTIRPDE